MEAQSKKILLVDDDQFILSIMGKALSVRGFECVKANSAEEAFDVLTNYSPDLILSDYEMPGINGFEFIKTLSTIPAHKRIPFVFLTSYTADEMKMEGLDLHAVDYITKDTKIDIIVSKLDNLIATVQEQNERSLLELKKAAETLNLKSVPDYTPELKNYYVDFWYHTFQNCPGGDFVDFIKVDERHTFVILGDVMGKKWGAWFFSFNFLSYIRSAIRLCVFDGNLSTRSILEKINKVICHDPVLKDVLSTLSMVLIDDEDGKILYTGAGDLPLIHRKKSDASVTQVNSNGLLLGMFEEGMYDEQYISFEKGDQLFILSDGMIDFEANDAKKTGYRELISFIKQQKSGNNVFRAITGEWISKNNRRQIDDSSIIFIERK